ncbi:IRK-interacting protein isoform X1 [Iris pallida]|uniref:IRK-interacting protein isoform X1 n=1 Tax=Iris pallida TaxID=29817 RepID=A0AAX6HXJ0_IRIPA|nr:IRK-interacting protein isoform X1 [Iris pallida]
MAAPSDAALQLALRGHGIQRQDIRAAMAKAVELRALHAALLQGTATASSSSPSLSRGPPPNNHHHHHHHHQLPSSLDYPVFTPSYEEQQLPGYHFVLPEDRSLSGNSGNMSERLEGETRDDEIIIPDTKSLENFLNSQLSNRSSYTNHFPILPNYSGANVVRASSRRTNSGDSMLSTTCSNTCKPAVSNQETENEHKKAMDKISVMPSTEIQPPPQLNSKHRGAKFSWLFPKSKKKPKSAMSPNTVESDDMSQILKDWGVFSIETMKKELVEANENRDAALSEVTEMKSSLGELREKLVNLESYCEQLKKALKQAQGKDTPKRTKPTSGNKDSSMPVSQEVMVEGFLQIASEARLSVKQFCKTLINQTEDANSDLMEKINVLLQPHQMNLSNKHSKGVLYHLEALINQSLYQDFENCVFQKNGCPKVLDPQQDRLDKFSSFVSLRNLSWTEVLRKGTDCYSEDFSRFCDQKMSGIVSVLNWLRPWPEQLLHSFFVAAKCIWLLHLLAFSFSPPLVILRVEEDTSFDPLYMEDILLDRQKAQAPAWVRIMVMPGFYVQDKVLRCRVLCRYRSVP